MKTSLKQNDFDRPTLKKGIEQTKSINRRKISRAIFLDRSPTVLQGGQISVLIRRGPFYKLHIYVYISITYVYQDLQHRRSLGCPGKTDSLQNTRCSTADEDATEGLIRCRTQENYLQGI